MAVILGTPGDDPDLLGTPGDDIITALGGDDTVHAGAGDDSVDGGDNDDRLSGGDGSDTLLGGEGDDYLHGGSGVDTYLGGNGYDRVSLFSLSATQGVVANLTTQTIANDGFGNAETMSSIEALGGGTIFADSFTGDAGANQFWIAAGDTGKGLGGDDTFYLSDAPALVDGGGGVDTIAGFWRYHLIAAPGPGLGGGLVYVPTTNGVVVDLLQGRIIDDGWGGGGVIKGIENLSGSYNVDTLTGDNRANVIHGLQGSDTVYGQAGDDVLWGDEGGDNLYGGAGNDVLHGGTDYNVLDGGPGDDILDGGGAKGVFAYDQVSYADAPGGIFVDLSIKTAQDTVSAGMDTLIRIEDVRGSSYADVILGSGIGNVMYAGQGDDQVHGRGGGDLIYAGAGADEVHGENGQDTIFGEQGADFLYGEDDDDSIDGGAGADVMDGGRGRDTLTGGAGADFMAGGQQADTFVYLDAADSTVAHPDTIADMTLEDFIDLTALDVLDYAMVTGDRHVDLTVNLTDGSVMAISITGYVDPTHILV